MISTGWGAFNRQGDDNGTILVYQKAGTKLVINVNTVTTLDNFPADFKNSLKVGEHLVFTAIGKAIQPPATTVVIPGTPTAEVKAGQKKVFTIELDKGGIITGELYPDLAPISVENFEKLANRGFYAGLTFHRVEPGFVVQGGDPKGDGTGGPGYNITGEFATNTALYKVPAGLEAKAKHVYGSLAWARSQDLNSAGSQFYIVIGQEADANVSSLNGKYAVFGKVTDGMDLVIKIAKGDKIKSVKVEVK
jgi:peptidyl-prolyl cis-trans isomerase B (cyclophilin B)